MYCREGLVLVILNNVLFLIWEIWIFLISGRIFSIGIGIVFIYLLIKFCLDVWLFIRLAKCRGWVWVFFLIEVVMWLAVNRVLKLLFVIII